MKRDCVLSNAEPGDSACRPHPFRMLALLGLALTLQPGATARADDGAKGQNSQVKSLVEKVASGDEVEAAAASEQLIELLTTPLADAIGPLSARPAAEQVRLRQMLARLTGALRVRVFRIDLPPEDRALFDTFAKSYPELVQRLFDGNWRLRKAAVHQIPLEPNTGAGVLIAAKVDDEDDDVAAAALEMAAKLHDPIVARNLTRYIRDATETIRSGFYGPEDQEIAATVAIFACRSIRAVAAARQDESAPAVVDAVRFFAHSRYWDPYQRSEALRALGILGDRRGGDLLLEFLDDPSPLRWQPGPNNERLIETAGDVALLSLLRVYQLKPEDFGLRVVPEQGDFAGYPDKTSRHDGHEAFRIWYEQHAAESSAPPRPATSQPASQDD